jgi:hypothetical protein
MPTNDSKLHISMMIIMFELEQGIRGTKVYSCWLEMVGIWNSIILTSFTASNIDFLLPMCIDFL